AAPTSSHRVPAGQVVSAILALKEGFAVVGSAKFTGRHLRSRGLGTRIVHIHVALLDYLPTEISMGAGLVPGLLLVRVVKSASRKRIPSDQGQLCIGCLSNQRVVEGSTGKRAV